MQNEENVDRKQLQNMQIALYYDMGGTNIVGFLLLET
jgi:hypothetical protein